MNTADSGFSDFTRFQAQELHRAHAARAQKFLRATTPYRVNPGSSQARHPCGERTRIPAVRVRPATRSCVEAVDVWGDQGEHVTRVRLGRRLAARRAEALA